MSGTFGVAPRQLKIFISSPGDVEAERNSARRVISLLDGRWGEHVRLSAYDYREESFDSLEGFQEQVPDVAQYDLVVGILWKRIGTQLNPAKFPSERGLHASGTVYELETAFVAAERQGRPDVVVFRKQAKVQYDESAVTQQMDQREKLLRWWQSCFGGPGEPVKRASISFEGPDDFEDTLEKWVEDWLRKQHLIPSGLSWNIARDGSPYPGLVAYEARHSRVFKGRDASIKRALTLLRRRAARGEWSLFVVGPSGSGKSSFARAGLGPRLLAAAGIEGVGVWRQVLLESSDDPISMLARRLFTASDVSPPALPELALGPQPSAESWAKLAQLSPESAAASVAWALDQVARRDAATLGSSHPLSARLLVIADQLEALAATAEFDALTALLSELVRRGGALLLATLRSDSYAVLQSDSALRALRGDDGVFDLPTPGREELREIIEAPAADAGLSWDVDERGRTLDDVLGLQVSSADALPLLQMTLHELFERRDVGGNVLTFAGYREIGGIEGAIATRADQTLKQLPLSAQAQLDALLREIVADVDGTGSLTMRTVARTWYDADGARSELIRGFVAARLLVEDVDHVRIAHEALLRHWPRARQSPALQTEALRLRNVLAPLAAAWSASCSDEDLVVAPALLAAAGEIVSSHPGALDPGVEAFVCAAEQALAAKREAALREGRSREVAAYARVELQVDQTQALRLAIEANDEAQTPEAFSALREAVHAARCQAFIDSGAPVTDLAFASNRPILATGHSDGSVQLWDAGSRQWLRTICEPRERGTRLAFDSQGKYLAVSHSSRVRIYEALSWSELTTFDCFNGVVSLDFSPDGHRIVVAHGATAEVRDTATGESLRRWNGAVIVSAYFSPDGRCVVGNFDDSYMVSIWDIESNRSVFDESTEGRVVSSAMDPQGKWLVTAGKSGVRLFILSRSEARRGIVVGNNGDSAMHVLLVDSNEFAVANENGIVSIWRFPGFWSDDPAWQPQLKQLAVLQGHRGAVWHLAWHAVTGLLASAGEDGTVELWRRQPPGIVSDPKWEAFAVLRRHYTRAINVAFAPDGSCLAGHARYGDARLWDTRTTREGSLFKVGAYFGFFDSKVQLGVSVLAFTSDSRRLLTLVRGGVARLWEPGSGRQIAILGSTESKDPWGVNISESPATSHAGFSPDGSLIVTAHTDGTAALWDSNSGEKPRSLKGHAVTLNYAQFDGDGRRVFTAGGDGTIRIWDVRTGRRMKNLGPLDSPPLATVIRSDGALLAATHEDQSVSLWEINSCRLISRVGSPDQPALDPVFDTAENALCTVGDKDGSMRVWDCATGVLKRQENLDVVRSSVYSAWNLQGRFFVATDSKGEARVWDRTRAGGPIVLRGHTHAVTAIAIAPDAGTLITGSDDGSARLWDLASGRQLALYRDHRSGVSRVAYSPDSRFIVTVANDGIARVWYARASELKEEARRRMPQRLSPANKGSVTI
jgi:WD40 repeat protein